MLYKRGICSCELEGAFAWFGYTCLNMDGAAKQYIGHTCCSGLLRDEHG